MKDMAKILQWQDMRTEAGQRAYHKGDERFGYYDSESTPVFDPVYWNVHSPERNCYGYALDSGVVLNPGGLSNAFNAAADALNDPRLPFDRFKQIVRANLFNDGIKSAREPGLFKPDHYLISLHFSRSAAPDERDYHFMRLDDTGRWSQVNCGTRFVSWTDMLDDPIKNPATAKFASLDFDGFYQVPKGGYENLVGLRGHAARQPRSASNFRGLP